MALQVVDVPDFLEENTQYDTKYKRTVRWDAEKGDFARDGANRLVECSGEEGFMIWCFKVAQTERNSCLAYDNNIGVEMETAKDDEREAIVESRTERTITDALMVNPRTEEVRDFKFTWDGDELHCTFVVKGVEWDKYFKISL